MKKLSIAVIGAGRIGKMHIENLMRYFPDISVKAVASLFIDKGWAKKCGIPVVTQDVQSVFSDSSIDAFIIATSSPAHVGLIKAAASAGRHVFCEKPIAFDPVKIAEAIEVAEKAGVILQVGYNRRFDPDFLVVKEAVSDGRLGKLHIIKITNRDPKRPDHDFVARSGGLFMDFNVHDFDMARFLTGSEITEIYAVGDALIDPALKALDDIDTAVITLRMDNGTLCVIDSSRETLYGYDQRLEVFGEKGAMHVNNKTATKTSLTTHAGVITEVPLYCFVERYQQAYVDQFKSFFTCIRENKKPIVDGYDAMQAVKAAVAARQSFLGHQISRLKGKIH